MQPTADQSFNFFQDAEAVETFRSPTIKAQYSVGFGTSLMKNPLQVIFSIYGCMKPICIRVATDPRALNK